MPHPARAAITIAMAGIAVPAVHAQFAVTLTADDTRVAIGDIITWTLAVTDGITTATFLQSYDLNFIASDNTLATASTFANAFTPLAGPTQGTAIGASISGASGGQSPLLDPLGTIFGSPVTIGTFQVVAGQEGTLTYTLADGGVRATTDLFKTPDRGFEGPGHDGAPDLFIADTVTIVPAPATLALLGLTPLALLRRRR